MVKRLSRREFQVYVHNYLLKYTDSSKVLVNLISSFVANKPGVKHTSAPYLLDEVKMAKEDGDECIELKAYLDLSELVHSDKDTKFYHRLVTPFYEGDRIIRHEQMIELENFDESIDCGSYKQKHELM